MKPIESSRRLDVEFQSEGVTCRAWHYVPDDNNSSQSPCIIMAHGLGGTKDSGLEPYAQQFVGAGFHVIVFDYRHFGQSDGTPRQLLLVKRQLADWRAAIEYVRTLDAVDPSKIALWGTSFSGGHVLKLAARELDIAAICAQNPMVDGQSAVQMLLQYAGLFQLLKMSAYAITDQLRSIVGLAPTLIPIIGKSGELAAISNDDAFEGYMEISSATWKNAMTARMVLTLPFYRPISLAHKIRCKVLLQPCMEDRVVSSTSVIKLAHKLGGLATLKAYKGMQHFDIYVGDGFECAVSDQVNFFQESLQ